MADARDALLRDIDAFLAEWPEAEFGPAHIVLSDWNLEDVHVRWCLGLCRATLSREARDLVTPYAMGTFVDSSTGSTYQKPAGDAVFMDKMQWYQDQDRDEVAATILLLERLLTIPEHVREAVDA